MINNKKCEICKFMYYYNNKSLDMLCSYGKLRPQYCEEKNKLNDCSLFEMKIGYKILQMIMIFIFDVIIFILGILASLGILFGFLHAIGIFGIVPWGILMFIFINHYYIRDEKCDY